MNLLSALPTLALLTSRAMAAVAQHCVAFEGPISGFTPVLDIRSHDLNTTVMVNHFEDIDDRLTFDMNLDMRLSVPESRFPVVESENGTVLFDESAIVRRHHYKGLHTVLGPGESISFSIETTGVYCALVYQDTDDFQVHGVDILASHIYGDIPMTRHLWAKLVPFAALVLLFHAYISPRLFPRMHPIHSSESLPTILLNALYGRFLISLIVGAWPFFVFNVSGMKRVSDIFQWITPHVLISEAIAVLVISVVFRVGLRMFGFRIDAFTAEHMNSLLDWASRWQLIFSVGYICIVVNISEHRFLQSLMLVLLASVQAACTSMDLPFNTEVENSEKFDKSLIDPRDFSLLEEDSTDGRYNIPLSSWCTLNICTWLMFIFPHLGWTLITSDRMEPGIENDVMIVWFFRTSGPTSHQWLITLCMFVNWLMGVTPLSSFFCKSH